MSHRHILVCSLVFVGLTSLSMGQVNFGGSDDFSAGNLDNWTKMVEEGSPDLTVTNEELNFTDGSALTAGNSSSAYVAWNLNQGALDADWSIYMDFDFNFDVSIGAGQSTVWALTVYNTADNTDNFYLALRWADGLTNPAGAVFFANNDNDVQLADSEFAFAGGDPGTLGIAYDSDQGLLLAGIDADGATNGYAFTSVASQSIADWSMSGTDRFGAIIFAENTVDSDSGTGIAIASGDMIADNFTAVPYNVSAVPEPATYSTLLGMLVLGWCGIRRRR